MENLDGIFKQLAERARKDGVDLEMMATGNESLKLGYQKGKPETFESSTNRVLGLRVIDEGRQGYSSTENMSGDAVERAYRDALENARMLPRVGKKVPLAESSDLPDAMKDLDRHEDVAMEKKMEVAKLLEEKALKKDPRVANVPYSNFNEGRWWAKIFNTKGLRREFSSSYYSGYSYVLAKDGESTKMDGDSFFTRDFSQIHVDEIVDEAVARAVSRLNAKRMETAKLPVLIDREAASMLISMLQGALSGKDVIEGKSFLTGKLGQKIAVPFLQLIDDPFDRSLAGVRPFDSEGSPSKRTAMIENGVLKNYFTNLSIAAETGWAHTASASRSPSSEMDVGSSNQVMAKGTEAREQLMKKHPKMLFLTDFTGGLHAGFKDSTGDFSMPAEGFLVENGKITQAVDQFVVSGNSLEVLQNIEALSSEWNKAVGSVLVPDILIRELSIAGAKS